MKTKLKLTNEVIRDVYVELCINGYDRDLAAEFVAAVRELRDLAKAVSDTAWTSKCVVCADGDGMRANRAFVTALREVLP